MTATDIAVTVLVLIGIFFLAYSSIRHQGLLDTVREIKQIFMDGVDKVKDNSDGVLKYA